MKTLKTAIMVVALALVTASCLRADATSVKYKTTLVRVDTPLVFQAKGVDADTAHWTLQNGIGGKWTITTSKKEGGVVVVTLLVTKPFRNREFDGAAAAPMIVWKDDTRQVNVPLTVIPAKSKLPRRGKEMKQRQIDGLPAWVIPAYHFGDWGKNRPLFYIRK